MVHRSYPGSSNSLELNAHQPPSACSSQQGGVRTAPPMGTRIPRLGPDCEKTPTLDSQIRSAPTLSGLPLKHMAIEGTQNRDHPWKAVETSEAPPPGLYHPKDPFQVHV